MAVYRDHPRTGGALVAHVVSLTGLAIAAGAGAFFLLILITALVGEEAFGLDYAPFDPIVRASVGLVSLKLVAGLGIGVYALALRRAATARQLADAARTDPDRVGTWADRRDLEIAGPFAAATTFTWFYVGAVVLAAILFVVALAETFRYNPSSAWEGVGVLVVILITGAVVAALGLVVRFVLRPRYRDAKSWVELEWDARARSAATRDERQTRAASAAEPVEFGGAHLAFASITRIASVVTPIVGAAGFVLFLAGVFLRQPCRRCDQIYWGQPVESVIDVLVVIGGPLLILAALIGIVAALAALARLVLERRMLRHLAETGAPRPRPAQLIEHLTQDGPGMWAGAALVGASVPAIVVAVLASAPVVAGVLVGVAAVGVAVTAWSVGADGRLRLLMREAWAPGDPVPPKPDARRKTTPTRDAGDFGDAD